MPSKVPLGVHQKKKILNTSSKNSSTNSTKEIILQKYLQMIRRVHLLVIVRYELQAFIGRTVNEFLMNWITKGIYLRFLPRILRTSPKIILGFPASIFPSVCLEISAVLQLSISGITPKIQVISLVYQLRNCSTISKFSLFV